MQNKTSLDSAKSLTGERLFWFSFLLLLIVFTTLGNIMVCLAVLKTRTLRTCSNLLVVNIAFGDIVCSLTTMPLSLVLLCFRNRWPLGHHGNITFDAIWLGTMVLSFINVTVIALERYIAIQRPFFYQPGITKQRVIICCCCLWIYTALLASTLTFTFRKPSNDEYTFRIPAHVYYPVLSFHAAFTFLLVPCLYVKIFITARRHKVKLFRQFRRDIRRQFYLQMKATRTIGLVILLFVIVWLPFMVKQYVGFEGVSAGLWDSVNRRTVYLTYCNGAVNIFVYSYRNRAIREALLKLVFSFRH